MNNRLYYHLKPYVPWRWRMAVRRVLARRKLQHHQDVWPINEAAARPPDGWTGWPDGKKFALVLTHDIEGPSGLAKCRQLMQLEQELGFRSSFNFIPEGDYRVPRELREELTQNGFEAGVHDLHHDGTLYWSRRDFSENAKQINRYLKEWGASGFRSGFMLNELDWLHDLDIQYDTSTFDTDPFEPQPFGQQTIFPFWVPRPSTLDVGYSPLSTPHSSRGYVELPYTLPQDSTLFLLFREPTIATWLKKLDWIVQNGGMALVNIHPDYVRFPGEPASIRTYPVELYAALLKHIRDRHAGRFWHVLPREMAQYAGKLISHKPRHRPLRVCMITHSYYSRDNRVIRYAESLAARGDHVDVLGLSSKPDVPREERLNGVNVMRLQERLSKSAASDVGYLRPILRFFFKASFWLTRHEGHRHYDLVHIHNIPDFLVFAAWYPRLRGARLILDIHDVVPEFFASKFTQPLNSWRIRALLLMERWSARFAHHVIIANHLWLRSYTTRSCPPAKCSVFINNANADLFHPQPRIRQDGRLIVMFPGGMQWHQGLDIGLRAFQKITAEFPTAEFHIYGDGNMKPQLVALAAELGLNGKVRFFDPVRVQEIARVMADADLGVVPKRADSFGNEAYSTKIMEFMFLGVPVVVSETKIDRYYFNDQVVKFFASGNHDAMAAAMSEVLRDRVNREEMVARAREYAYANSWETRKADYLKLVDDLCSA